MRKLDTQIYLRKGRLAPCPKQYYSVGIEVYLTLGLKRHNQEKATEERKRTFNTKLYKTNSAASKPWDLALWSVF